MSYVPLSFFFLSSFVDLFASHVSYWETCICRRRRRRRIRDVHANVNVENDADR